MSYFFPISASVNLPSKGQIMSLSDARSEFWRGSVNLQGGLDFKTDHFLWGLSSSQSLLHMVVKI